MRNPFSDGTKFLIAEKTEAKTVFATFEEAREFAEKALLKTGLFQRASGLEPLARLKASARNALLFASYAGACYLHDENSTIVPAGAHIYGEFLSLAYPPLLFAVNESTYALYYPSLELSLGRSLMLSNKTIKSLLEGEKYLVIRKVIPGEREKKRVLKEQLHQLLSFCREKGLAPTDVIVHTIHLGASGYCPGEDFYGYLAGVEFVRRGYLVTKTNPIQIGPADDLLAFKPQDIERGAFLLELMLGMAELSPTKSTEGETVFMEIEDTPREISQRHGLPKVIDCLDNFTQSYIVAPFIEHCVKRCDHCGSPLPEGAARCPSCQAELGWGGHLGRGEEPHPQALQGKGERREEVLDEINYWIEKTISH